MRHIVLLTLLVILGCNTAAADTVNKTNGFEYANRWSKLFIGQNERIESVELVFEGDAVLTKQGFKPEVFIKVNDGKGGYSVGFFNGHVIRDKAGTTIEKENNWRSHYSTVYQEGVSLDDLIVKKPIAFEDSSYLDPGQPIYNNNGGMTQDMLDVNFPNSCLWTFNYKPISRLLWLYDSQDFKDRYKWQKYVIFRYPNKTKQYLSYDLKSNQETRLDECNADSLIEHRYKTETKINSILDLKDGTILVAGDHFIVRLRVKDGKMLLSNSYIRVVDAEEVGEYLNQLDDFYSKNQITNSEKESLSFQKRYFRYVDELVYKKWFEK